MPLYLHFLDRELATSVKYQLTPRLLSEYIGTILPMTSGLLYCSLSLLYENSAARESSELLSGLIKSNCIRAISPYPTVDEFLDAKRREYAHDRTRYEFYYTDTTNQTQGLIIQPSTGRTTPELIKSLTSWAHETENSTPRISESVLAAIRERDDRAITIALFRDRLLSTSDSTSIQLTARQISRAYTNRFISQLRGKILTGIPGLEFFDSLQQWDPIHDYPVLKTMMPLLGIPCIKPRSYIQFTRVERGFPEHEALLRDVASILGMCRSLAKNAGAQTVLALREHTCELLRTASAELPPLPTKRVRPFSHAALERCQKLETALQKTITLRSDIPHDYLSFRSYFALGNSRTRQMENRTDILIVSIRQDEYTAVAKRIPMKDPERILDSYVQFGEIPTSKGFSLRVAATRSPEQGNTPMQQLLQGQLRELNPYAIILVGIGGAFPDSDFGLGDVMGAVRISDLQLQSIGPTGDTESGVSGGNLPMPVSSLMAMLGQYPGIDEWRTQSEIGMRRPELKLNESDIYGDDAWKKKVRDSIDGSLRRSTSIFNCAGIASSNTLIKNTSAASEWRRSVRNTHVVEMEAAGAFAAACRGTSQVPLFVIRGISDVIGYRRTSEWTRYACEAAASLTNKLVRHGVLRDFSDNRYLSLK